MFIEPQARGVGRRAAARHDRAVRQRRLDRAGRSSSPAARPAFAERMNAEAKRLGLPNTHFANATGLSRSAALLDGGRPRAARRGADPRLSRVLPAVRAQGVPLQQHHAAEPQPAAVDRPLRRRRQDRAHRRRGLVPDRLGEARRAAAAVGGARRGVRRGARDREPEAPQLRLPGLRHRAALPVRASRCRRCGSGRARGTRSPPGFLADRYLTLPKGKAAKLAAHAGGDRAAGRADRRRAARRHGQGRARGQAAGRVPAAGAGRRAARQHLRPRLGHGAAVVQVTRTAHAAAEEDVRR